MQDGDRNTLDIEKTIERYIVDELLLGKKPFISADESLIGSGVLDSLTLLELISFVEKRFDLEINDSEMTPDHFQTISHIRRLIEAKRAHQ